MMPEPHSSEDVDARLEERARREAERAGSAKFGRRHVIQLVITVAVLAFIFVGVLPKVADYGSVWRTVTSMTLNGLVSSPVTSTLAAVA